MSGSYLPIEQGGNLQKRLVSPRLFVDAWGQALRATSRSHNDASQEHEGKGRQLYT